MSFFLKASANFLASFINVKTPPPLFSVFNKGKNFLLATSCICDHKDKKTAHNLRFSLMENKAVRAPSLKATSCCSLGRLSDHSTEGRDMSSSSVLWIVCLRTGKIFLVGKIQFSLYCVYAINWCQKGTGSDKLASCWNTVHFWGYRLKKSWLIRSECQGLVLWLCPIGIDS